MSLTLITPDSDTSEVDQPPGTDSADAHTWNPLPATWRSPCRSPREPTPILIADDAAVGHDVPSASSKNYHRLVASAATVLLEILQGRRPVTQAARLCTDQASASLISHVVRFPWAKARLAAVRESSSTEDAVEAAMRLAISGHYLSAVLRLEATDGRWLCTQFDVLYPGWVR